jgi:hypothetical protein
MMRLFFLLLMPTVLFTTSAYAQAPSRWNYGISTHYSFEKYNMTYNTLHVDRPDVEYKNSAKSAFAGGGGVWAERRVGNLIALYTRLDYHSVRIDDEFFSGWYIKVGGGRPYQEWHRSLSLAIHARFYIPAKSKFKVHLDAGLKTDRMIIFRSRYSHFDFREWNHRYFNDLVPGWVGGLGVQYGRVGLSLEYHDFPWNDALTKQMADNLRLGHLRQHADRNNFTINTTFRLNRGK